MKLPFEFSLRCFVFFLYFFFGRHKKVGGREATWQPISRLIAQKIDQSVALL